MTSTQPLSHFPPHGATRPRFVRLVRETGVPHLLKDVEAMEGCARCDRCGGFEGSLLASCPLIDMTYEEGEVAYRAYCELSTFGRGATADMYNTIARRYNDSVLDGAVMDLRKWK